MFELLLAHQITAALIEGSSVAATGLGDTDAALDLAAQELTEARMRVLQLRPPFHSARFAEQFAAAWHASSLPRGNQAPAARAGVALAPSARAGVALAPAARAGVALTVPNAAAEPFAVLVHDAHLLPRETLRHLDRMALNWTPMRLAFAGNPEFVDLLADSLPTLRSKVTAFVNVPARRPVPRPPVADLPPRPSLAALAAAEADSAGYRSRPAAVPPAAIAASAPGPLREARHGAVTVVAGLVAAAAVVWLAAVPAAVPRLRAFVAGRDEARPIAAAEPHAGEPPPAAELGRFKTADLEPEILPAPPSLKMPMDDAAASGAPPVKQPAAVLTPAATGLDQDAAERALVPSETASIEPHEPVSAPSRAVDKFGVPDSPEPLADLKASEATASGPVTGDTAPEPPPVTEATAVTAAAAPQPEPAEPDSRPAKPLVQPAVAPPAAVAAGLSPGLAEAMVRRGRTMLEQGNVSAARLLFGRAAEAGYGPAARAMATTYDAALLEQIGVFGIRPDPKEAATWYQRALVLGDADASTPLERLNYGGERSAAQSKVNP